MAMSPSEFKRRQREAARKLERAVQAQQRAAQQEIDRVNRHNKKVVDDHNRELDRVNRANAKTVNNHNREVARRNDAANKHNEQVSREISSRLSRATNERVRYQPAERHLVERVHEAIVFDDGREYDVFISYARIDGEGTAHQLRAALEQHEVSVWFDQVAIQPGKSQSRQMDSGLMKARAGIAILTPAYLTGRFWTERELGALLNKPTLIPVLHGVTFDDVKEYSGILPDLAGFTTADDDIDIIAEKIAPALAE